MFGKRKKPARLTREDMIKAGYVVVNESSRYFEVIGRFETVVIGRTEVAGGLENVLIDRATGETIRLD